MSGRRVKAGLRKLVTNTALLLMSCVVALLIAEGLVRLLAPQQLISIRPDIWQPADTVGWLHRPHVNAEINTGERTIRLFTDHEGFRVGLGGRIEAERRVLLLGDSFMEALQVEYEKSFAGLLESRLSEPIGDPVAVRNAAVVGWGPNQYFLRARQLLARDSFDLVLVAVYLSNDVEDRRVGRIPPRAPVKRKWFRVPRSLRWKELVDATLAPVNDILEVRSHLYLLVKNRMESLRIRLGLIPPYYPVAVLRSEVSSPRWAVTAELCRDIADLASAEGIPTLFVLIPAPYQVDPQVFDRHARAFGIEPDQVDLDQPDRLLGRELMARDIEFIDALPAFRAAHAEGRRLYGTVDRHLSPAGHEVLGDVVTPHVARLLRRTEAVDSND